MALQWFYAPERHRKISKNSVSTRLTHFRAVPTRTLTLSTVSRGADERPSQELRPSSEVPDEAEHARLRRLRKNRPRKDGQVATRGTHRCQKRQIHWRFGV